LLEHIPAEGVNQGYFDGKVSFDANVVAFSFLRILEVHSIDPSLCFGSIFEVKFYDLNRVPSLVVEEMLFFLENIVVCYCTKR